MIWNMTIIILIVEKLWQMDNSQKEDINVSLFPKYVICSFCEWASLQRGVSNPVTNSFKA